MWRAATLESTFDHIVSRSCCLVLEYIPGRGLFKAADALEPSSIEQTAEDLGRLFTLGGPCATLVPQALGEHWWAGRRLCLWSAAEPGSIEQVAEALGRWREGWSGWSCDASGAVALGCCRW